MNILITGSNGLLGQYLVRDLANEGYKIIATGRGNNRLPEYAGVKYISLDITDKAAVFESVENNKPDIVIHAAAMTQPDACELNKEQCRATNVLATAYLAEAVQKSGSNIIYISTDFVFNGKEGPYTEEDTPDPVNFTVIANLQPKKL